MIYPIRLLLVSITVVLIDGGENPRTVARTLGVDRATMYRHLAKLAD